MVPSWADQLLLQLLWNSLILCLYNVDTLNICMKEFGLEKIIFDKMTAVRTSTIFPSKAFVYAWMVPSWADQLLFLLLIILFQKQHHITYIGIIHFTIHKF